MLNITSASNSTIKKIKNLYRRKQRWAKKMFLIEGIKIVEESIDNDYSIKNIVYSDDLFDVQGGEVFFNRIKHDERLIHVPRKLYREISDMESPQGILGVVEFQINLIENASLNDKTCILLLDKVKDPGNMGAIIRTADAFGIDGVIVTEGCVDIYNSKVVRATMGSIFRVPIYNESNGVEIIKELKKKGLLIYSTSLEESKYIQNVDFNKSCVLIIGNESRGVSQDIIALADELIKIPMPGGAESLNAAIASSIIMYEATMQRTQ